jgi:hypothetical protein
MAKKEKKIHPNQEFLRQNKWKKFVANDDMISTAKRKKVSIYGKTEEKDTN